MLDSRQFTGLVFQTMCAWFNEKRAHLRMMLETGTSFEQWLTWEAYLACKFQEADGLFSEVTAKPAYASEGVADDGSGAERDLGDLRVGGPDDGANHCWVFAEFILLLDGHRSDGAGFRIIEAKAEKLLRLGWKKSSSLLVVVMASKGDAWKDWAEDLGGCAVWNLPALTRPHGIALPGSGTVVLRALDIKRNPEDILTIDG